MVARRRPEASGQRDSGGGRFGRGLSRLPCFSGTAQAPTSASRRSAADVWPGSRRPPRSARPVFVPLLAWTAASRLVRCCGAVYHGTGAPALGRADGETDWPGVRKAGGVAGGAESRPCRLGGGIARARDLAAARCWRCRDLAAHDNVRSTSKRPLVARKPVQAVESLYEIGYSASRGAACRRARLIDLDRAGRRTRDSLGLPVAVTTTSSEGGPGLNTFPPDPGSTRNTASSPNCESAGKRHPPPPQPLVRKFCKLLGAC